MNFNELRAEFQTLSLDELLGQLEIDISRVGQANRDAALRMLLKMDQVFLKLAAMSQKGNAVKAEAAQFDYITASLEKNARKFLIEIGGAEQLAALRQQVAPQNDQTWWFIDLAHQRQVRATLRQALIGIGGLLAGLVLVVILYNQFFAPDPIVAKRYSLELDADQSMASGDFAKALESVDQALAIVPQDNEMLILRGVLNNRLGKAADAETDFSHAEGILNNRELFLLLRTEAWIKTGALPEGLKDVQTCIRDYPESAQGYYYYGRINELDNNYNKAIDAYNRASALAEKQGKMELNATIRMTMAMLMQSMPVAQPALTSTPQK
jgi:tetratricopeptide (TPR) repeat protein